jgi:hypothetical protein
MFCERERSEIPHGNAERCEQMAPQIGSAPAAERQPKTQDNRVSLRGFMAPPDDWAIDWGRFIDIDNRQNGVMLDDNGKINGQLPTSQEVEQLKHRLQLAYRIDTSLVFPQGILQKGVADPFIRSLAERNLLRGWRLRLPNGQAVAKAMGVTPLETILIGKFEGEVEAEDINDLKDENDKPITNPANVFENNCPLWAYCLAETNQHTIPGKFGVNSKLLGEVGGRIVAETFAGLLVTDSQSFLSQDPRWKPTLGGGGTFGLREFVKFALSK